MQCDAARRLLPAYGDNELSVESALAVERHLLGCARCRALVDGQRDLSSAIARLYPRDPMPPDLEHRVRRALHARASRGVWLGGLALAASALLVLAAGWGLLRSGGPGSPEAPAAVLAAARWHRTPPANEALALRSSDPAEVNAFLKASLPFQVAEPLQTTDQMTLEGAAVVELAGEQAGYVRYRSGAHRVSLYLLSPRAWPGAGERVRINSVDFHLFNVGGLSLIAWNHPPLSYVLASDLGARGARACGACHGGAIDEIVRHFPTDDAI